MLSFYKELEELGFEESNGVTYWKCKRDGQSIDFTYFYKVGEPMLRIFYNDHSNWFVVKDFNQFKTIYDFYWKLDNPTYASVQPSDIETLGFTKSGDGIYMKKFRKFMMHIIQGHVVHTTFVDSNDNINFDYVSSKEQLEELICFYNNVI